MKSTMLLLVPLLRYSIDGLLMSVIAAIQYLETENSRRCVLNLGVDGFIPWLAESTERRLGALLID